MTIHEESTGAVTTTSSAPSAGDAARAAADKAPAVARDSADHAKEVASEAADQAKAVVGQAKDHVQNLVGQARTELSAQADARSVQAATSLQTLSGQLAALRDGRPEAAGPLTSYLEEAEQRINRWAVRLRQGGAQSAIDDVSGFARRRPGLFLAGAAGLGFIVGRVARSGASVAKEQHDMPDGRAAMAPAVALPPPDPFLGAPASIGGETGTRLAGTL